MNWQPIETYLCGPYDCGETVLFWCPDQIVKVFVGYGSRWHCIEGMPEFDYTYFADDGWVYRPTHWMTLPDAP